MSEVIQRYEDWLKRGYEPSPYFKNEQEWNKELQMKILEIKNKK